MADTSIHSGSAETVKVWSPKGKPKKLKKKAGPRPTAPSDVGRSRPRSEGQAINPIPGKPGKYYDDASDRVVRKPR